MRRAFPSGLHLGVPARSGKGERSHKGRACSHAPFRGREAEPVIKSTGDADPDDAEGMDPGLARRASRNDGGESRIAQARPTLPESMAGSMPMPRSARSYFASRSVLKISAGSAGQFSQPLAMISLSSWPACQPA